MSATLYHRNHNISVLLLLMSQTSSDSFSKTQPEHCVFALGSLCSLLPLLLISCVSPIHLSLSPPPPPPYLSVSLQPARDRRRLFIADKAANFINYEAICYSVCKCGDVCVWCNVGIRGGPLKWHLVHSGIQGAGE